MDPSINSCIIVSFMALYTEIRTCSGEEEEVLWFIWSGDGGTYEEKNVGSIEHDHTMK